MANLDAIIKELRQERDRLEAAIEALTSISGNTLKAPRSGRTMSPRPADELLPHNERDGRSKRVARQLRAQEVCATFDTRASTGCTARDAPTISSNIEVRSTSSRSTRFSSYSRSFSALSSASPRFRSSMSVLTP
jgi:hypothetical protein